MESNQVEKKAGSDADAISRGVGILTMIVLAPVLSGFVLSTLWAWLVIPTFHVGAISVAQATGLRVVTAQTFRQNYEREPFAKSVVNLVAFNLAGLGIGWVVAKFL